MDADLTCRERRVMELVSAGLTSHEIGVQLRVSAATVDSHVSSAMGKLGAKGRRQAALQIRDDASPERCADHATKLDADQATALAVIAMGGSISEAGAVLNYSRRTVSRRLAGARAALGVRTTAEAAVLVTQRGGASGPARCTA